MVGNARVPLMANGASVKFLEKKAPSIENFTFHITAKQNSLSFKSLLTNICQKKWLKCYIVSFQSQYFGKYFFFVFALRHGGRQIKQRPCGCKTVAKWTLQRKWIILTYLLLIIFYLWFSQEQKIHNSQLKRPSAGLTLFLVPKNSEQEN